MNTDLFFEWIVKVVSSFANIGNWLVTPLQGINIAPIWILTGTGLIAFMVIAVVKWVVS